MTTEPARIVWPPEEQKQVLFQDSQVLIDEQIFGALSQEGNNPFSRISIANSSFSLDPYKGCPLGCAYCTVAGSASDLSISQDNAQIKFGLPTKPERLFSGVDLAENLIRHPAFLKNKSVVSIGTGSTEAFLDKVENDTWLIMKKLLDSGYKNPFWIVTKYGMPDHLVNIWAERINQLSQNGIPVVLSITYSGAPTWVEPYKENRFRNLVLLQKAGARVSHHLRPIIPGINDNDESIDKALSASLDIVENICVGGLRKDAGVELAWHHFHHRDLSLLPNTNREKILPDEYFAKVEDYIQKKGYKTPVFRRSSEAISNLLGIADYNLYKYRSNDGTYFLQISAENMSYIENHFAKKTIEYLKSLVESIQLLDVEFTQDGDKIMVSRDLSYQEHRAIIHVIGHSKALP